MGRKLAVAVLALGVALVTAGCLVEVREVRDPRPAFERARADAARVQGRSGPAQRLNVLAYDPDDRELARLSLPMWLARKAARDGEFDADLDDEGDVGRRVKQRLRGRDLDGLPLGVLVEIEDKGGERVLIWLD